MSPTCWYRTDLHPIDAETRVKGALDEVRPYLESHGGDVELLGVGEGTVRLRLEGSCSGCPSSAMTLKLAIEDAIHKAAPEVESAEAGGALGARLRPEAAPARGGARPGAPTGVRRPATARPGQWRAASPSSAPEPQVKRVAGEPVFP